MKEHISTVNMLVSIDVEVTPIAKIITANVKVDLPYALINQCIQDEKSIVKK